MSRRIVVAGAIANKVGSGGEAWVRMSWVRGFAELGYDVDFVEQIGADACVDETGAPADAGISYNRRYFDRVIRRFGLDGSATLVVDDGRTFGHRRDEMLDRIREADLLVDISGHLRDEGLARAARRSVLVDIDPGFTQYWHAMGVAPIPEHDVYFTIGENIGSSTCSIPTCGRRWHATRQPVVLDDWPVSDDATRSFDRFSTVGNWRGPYGAITIEGRILGLKVHEFRKVIALPTEVEARFELAMSFHPADAADRDALRATGWDVVDPAEHCAEPDAFRRYVQASSAEFSVAQGVYVETRSGWFSDRTARYLASGLPVLVQDTGFSGLLPTGLGIVPFSTYDEAIAGARDILARYDEHRIAARSIAESRFASDVVLSRFLETATA